MKASGTFLVSLSAIALAFAVPAAQAQPQIIQTSCDTLSIDPPRVRVTFAVVNLSPIPVCSVHLIPIPSGPYEPCYIFACSRPPGWDCFADTLGAAHWRVPPSPPPNACIAPYEKTPDFDFIIDPPYCCYRVLYDGPDGRIFYESTVCFQCESPVNTAPRSWGQLKLMYR